MGGKNILILAAKLLGVLLSADTEALRQAYRRLAMQVHPDKPGGDKELFQAIRQAYELLSDAPSRQAYEQARAAWLKQHRAIDCPECGQANRISKGSGQRCPACKTVLSEWTAAGRLKREGRVFLDETITLAQGFAERSANLIRQESADHGRALGELAVDWIRAYAGVPEKKSAGAKGIVRKERK